MNRTLVEYARYKYVIENIKDVIWELDTELVFTFVSSTAKGMTGYKPEEMIGRCMLDFLIPESKANICKLCVENINEKVDDSFKTATLYDLGFICKDGSIIWCEVSAKPVFESKNFIGYIGTTRDISEKKAYEDKLKCYIEELKCKNEQLEKLVTLDMLTGAYNRRKFEYFVGLEIEKKKKYGSPFSIIMF
ncbi:MAG: sensor domain-containing diguanylate cyclase, partial [Bacillota bacterium]